MLDSGSVLMVEPVRFLMDWMWGNKERGSKEDTKVSDLSIWQNGVSTYLDGMDDRREKSGVCLGTGYG